MYFVVSILYLLLGLLFLLSFCYFVALDNPFFCTFTYRLFLKMHIYQFIFDTSDSLDSD